MTVAAGTRLGSYEVEAALGAGGMGEVYRARDTRLERMVAIKVLPAELSSVVQGNQGSGVRHTVAEERRR